MNRITGTNTVVHITTPKQHAQLKKHFPKMSDWKDTYNYYLVSKSNTGFSQVPYDSTNYNSLRFEYLVLPLPEKWAINGPGELEEFLEWLPASMRRKYSGSSIGYFHYPNYSNGSGFKSGDHTSGDIYPDYVEISHAEFVASLRPTSNEPLFWHIYRDESNADILNDWENKRRGCTAGNLAAHRRDTALFCNYGNYGSARREDSVEITLEQFKEYTKRKNVKYVFKPGFEKFAVATASIVGSHVESFVAGTTTYDILKAAGVLDLWFEEVENIQVGSWVTIEEAPTSWDSTFADKNSMHAVYPFTGQIEKMDYRAANISGWGFSLPIKMRPATSLEIHDRDKVEFCGYEAEKILDGVKFGCQTISTEVLNSLENLLNRKEFVFKATINDVDVSLAVIRKLQSL